MIQMVQILQESVLRWRIQRLTEIAYYFFATSKSPQYQMAGQKSNLLKLSRCCFLKQTLSGGNKRRSQEHLTPTRPQQRSKQS